MNLHRHIQGEDCDGQLGCSVGRNQDHPPTCASQSYAWNCKFGG